MNMRSKEETVFKICSREEWHLAIDNGIYNGSALDLSDGFIHLSTRDQVVETAQLHFRGLDDLVLVAIDPSGLDIRYEESRNGQMFPHLYSDLPVESALNVQSILLDENGIPLITMNMLAIDQ